MNIENFFKNAKEKINGAMDWAFDNPEKAAAAVASMAGLMRASQSLVVSHRIKNERRYAERRFYDNRTHTTWSLRRPLTNNEKYIIQMRQGIGESAFDILSDMGVLR